METQRQDLDAIQDDIHRTRASIDESLRAIEDKLSPGELIGELIRYFRSDGDGKLKGMGSIVGSKAGDLLSSLTRTVKEHPVPAALIGIGLLSLLDSSDSSDGADRHARGEGPLAQTGEKLAEAGEKAGEKLESLAHDARETVERKVDQVRARLEDDPIVLGALGIALGAALGAALPGTRIEDQTLGHKRDELLSKAKHAGEQLRDEAKDVARELAGAALGDGDGRQRGESSHRV